MQHSPGRKPWVRTKEQKALQGRSRFLQIIFDQECKTSFVKAKIISQPAPPLQGLTESYFKPRVKEHAQRAPSPWALLRRAFSAPGM